MTIEVEYNEFRNWEQPIKVQHPSCTHDKIETFDKVVGDKTIGTGIYCIICEATAEAEQDDDGEVFYNCR